MPGRMPPTSQLDWLISTTAMIVLFWSRAKRDLLKSFGWGIGHSISCVLAAIDGAISPPAPYHLSAGGGSQPPMPRDRDGPVPRFARIEAQFLLRLSLQEIPGALDV